MIYEICYFNSINAVLKLVFSMSSIIYKLVILQNFLCFAITLLRYVHAHTRFYPVIYFYINAMRFFLSSYDIKIKLVRDVCVVLINQ